MITMKTSNHSLFSRHRTSSVERELARTPYAFTPKPREDPTLASTSSESIRLAKEIILDPFEDDITVRLAKERLFGGYSRSVSRSVSPTIFPSNDDFERKLKKIESDVENDLFGQNVSFDALSNISERLSETSSVKNFDDRVDRIFSIEKKSSTPLSSLNGNLPPKPKVAEKSLPRKFSDFSRTSTDIVFKVKPSQEVVNDPWRSKTPDFSISTTSKHSQEVVKGPWRSKTPDFSISSTSKHSQEVVKDPWRSKTPDIGIASTLNPVIYDQNKNRVFETKRILQRHKTADEAHIKRMVLARNSQDSITKSSELSEVSQKSNETKINPNKPSRLSRYQQSRALAEAYTDRFYKSIQLNRSVSSGDSDNNYTAGDQPKSVDRKPTDEAFKILAPPLPPPADLESIASDASSYKVQPTVKPHRNTAFAILGEAIPLPPSQLISPPVVAEVPPPSVSLRAVSGRVSPFRGRGFKTDPNSRHTTPRPSTNTSPQISRANSFIKPDIVAKVQTRLEPDFYHRSPTPTPRNYIKENIEDVKEVSEFNREKNMLLAEQKRINEEMEILQELGILDSKGLLTHGTNVGDLYSRSGSPTGLNTDRSGQMNGHGVNRRQLDRMNLRKMSKSQPQSKTGSPSHTSRIPMRVQESPFSPLKERNRSNLSPSKMSNRINSNGRFISNSTGSIYEKRVYTVLPGDSNEESTEPSTRRTRSRNNQNVNTKSKSPGKLGPPPTRGNINSKRLSPIESTPDKSPSSMRGGRTSETRGRTPLSKTPSSLQINKRGTKSLATSPTTSRAPSRAGRSNSKETPIKKATPTSKTTNSRGGSRASTRPPQGRGTNSVESSDNEGKPLRRSNSRSSITSINQVGKPELKRTNSKTSILNSKLSRQNSTKSIYEKTGALRRKPSSKNLNEKGNEDGSNKGKDGKNKNKKNTKDQEEETDSIPKQDNETQYDKLSQMDISMDKLIPLTKTSVVSMTTAAITAQPLEIAAKVTSQLPAAFEKARERGIFDRINSSDSIANKPAENKEGTEEEAKDGDSKLQKTASKSSIKDEKSNLLMHDNMKLKPISDSQLDPKVEKVKQKIDNILKSTSSSIVDLRDKVSNEDRQSADKVKQTLENVSEKVDDLSKAKEGDEKSTENSEKRPDSASSRTADQVRKAISKKIMDEVKKNKEKNKDIVASASNAFMNGKSTGKTPTPTETPKAAPPVATTSEAAMPAKVEATPIKELSVVKKEETVKKESLLPSVTVINERPAGISEAEEISEQIVRGDPDIEVQSGNTSLSMLSDMKDQNFNDTHPKIHDDNKVKERLRGKSEMGESSKQGIVTGPSNGAGNTSKLPQTENKPSESTKAATGPTTSTSGPSSEDDKAKTGCAKFLSKLLKKPKTEVEVVNEKAKKKTSSSTEAEKKNEKKFSESLSKLNCFSKKKADEPNISIVPKNEMAPTNQDAEKGRWGSCICCRGKNKVRDSSQGIRDPNMTEQKKGWRSMMCCCKTKAQKDQEWAARRDSILSQSQQPQGFWQKMMCWKKGGDSSDPSRRTSMFSKKRSLSQAVPIDDKKNKLDPTLVEHGSLIRAAIPALPIPLAWICFVFNILIPGLGTLLSGLFCLCFGVPRFGVHDGWKPRIGAFLIDLFVGVGQTFTVMFCLVGWGWSIWWATIMIKVAKKYKKMRETKDMEQPAPSTNNNRANNHA